jgi:adenylosuccinate lyase
MSFTYKDYLSPFTYRYGSDEMRHIFSEENKFLTYRRVWTALAKAQFKLGLMTKKEYMDIKRNSPKIDIAKSQKLEKNCNHDLFAELKLFESQCKTGGGKLHMGATSSDIIDNAEVLRYKRALGLIISDLFKLLKTLKDLIKAHKNTVCMAYTHIQPAEPTTLGYRFSFYAQDILTDLDNIFRLLADLKGKGFKGAVGNQSGYLSLFNGNMKKVKEMEKCSSKDLGINFFDVSTQIYTRKQDYNISTGLSSIALTLHKMSLDIRILQSANFGDISEYFSKDQVGSSAMPFKKNPIISERISSISRLIKSLTDVLWDNGANSILERTLDDSANKRIVMPELFLATDEVLNLSIKLLNNLKVNTDLIKSNLLKWGIFSATEPILMELAKKGMSRQNAHELLRELSMKAWNEVTLGKANPLLDLIKNNNIIKEKISLSNLEQLLKTNDHTGTASEICDKIITKIIRFHNIRSLK